MNALKRMRVSCVLALTCVLCLAAPAYAQTTTEETGPITQHEAQVYTFDMGAEKMYRGSIEDVQEGSATQIAIDGTAVASTATGSHWWLWLFPGDSLEVIPQTNEGTSQADKGYYWPGNYSGNDGNYHGDRGPITVTACAQYGETSSATGENFFIQGVRNDGEGPVLLTGGGGGGGYTSSSTSPDAKHYGVKDLGFYYYRNTVNVKYELYDNKTNATMADDVAAGAAYYTDETNPTVFYALDAITNYQSWKASNASFTNSDYPVSLTVWRPYIEGYALVKADSDNDAGSKYFEYTMDSFYVKENSFNWYGDSTTIYPKHTGSTTGSYFAQLGTEDDYELMRYRYDYGRTLTLDAMGGTIDGYASRIYEMPTTNNGLGIELSDGTMDKKYADGTAWVPVREGYLFCGWCEDEACTQPIESFKAVLNKYSSSDSDVSKRACHLYAKWRLPSEVSLESRTVAYTGDAIALTGAQATGSTGDITYACYSDEACTKAVDASDVGAPGTYYVQATVAEDDTYATATSEVATLTVVADLGQATLTGLADKVYTGAALTQKPAVSLLGTTLVEGTHYKLSYQNNVNAGTATVTVEGLGAYAETKVSGSFTISPAASSIKLAAQTKTYTGKALAYSGTVTKTGSAGAVTYAYYSDAACTKAVAAASVVSAGTYYVRATVAAQGNYAAATSAAAKFTISPAASSIKLAAQTKTYTGKALAYSGKVTKSGSAGKVTYAYYSDAKCTKTVKAAAVKNPGTYYVKATVAAKGNYAKATSAAAKLTVLPKATKLSKVTAAKKAFTVKWKKQATQTTGYQIQYSTSKTFAKGNKTLTIKKTGTTSKKVTGLKAKTTYYVRVRTYKKVGGKTYYSAWSAKKAVKTKA